MKDCRQGSQRFKTVSPPAISTRVAEEAATCLSIRNGCVGRGSVHEAELNLSYGVSAARGGEISAWTRAAHVNAAVKAFLNVYRPG